MQHECCKSIRLQYKRTWSNGSLKYVWEQARFAHISITSCVPVCSRWTRLEMLMSNGVHDWILLADVHMKFHKSEAKEQQDNIT